MLADTTSLGNKMNIAATEQRDLNGALSGKSGLILRELESRFVRGDYLFGQLLSINALAEEFDASRQPVSMAVNHLRSMGYVTIVPQVGCKVVSPEKSEIADFFYMLGKAEGAIAGMAASRWVDGDIDQLQQIEAVISDTAFDTMEHRSSFAGAVDHYHFKIHDIARSSRIGDWLEGLWRLANFYLWQGAEGNFSPARIETANKERRAIIRAIKRRDVSLAESLMEGHVSGKPRRVGVV
jgi:DNA-binding GntR family transcriptional regulator